MNSAAGKNPDVDISKGRLPGGRAFMPKVGIKRLTKVWQEESAGKTKQMLEACRRRKEGPEHPGNSPGDGTGLLDCPGLASPHARGKSSQAL